ncbi:hypothetical protein ACXU4B_12285 [Dyella soli]|uniref:Nitrogen fixation protein FixH n=1 Tax=Dyella soli TaxID=522319 RepID=A0A4R0YFX7_9GAMM|nr:hypothetical protein [Dyella soli]TCI07073.1 hypothetical protein EZM97_31155 [Dyella soli]
MNTTRSAWREPMVWMLVGLPLASVAIGFALLFAAVHPGREDMETVGRVTRVGKLLVSAEAAAPATEVDTQGVVLRTRGDMLEVLPMDGDFPRGGKLILTLSDASGGGHTFHLSPSELGWRGVGSLEGDRDWTVQLAPDNATWRLHGRWMPRARSTRLMP